jgi:hypothetical protein
MRRSTTRAFRPPGGILADLHDYLIPCPPTRGRPVKHPLTGWRVLDDWPERVPVTSGELDILEAWLGDILDELFAAPGEPEGLCAACRGEEQK